MPERAELPETGFVRLPTILRVLPVSKSTWWDGVRSGRFPRPVRLGRVTMWRAEDIRSLIEHLSEEAL
jgi:predicted DNA-binding transcriptional regulator AlpA